MKCKHQFFETSKTVHQYKQDMPNPIPKGFIGLVSWNDDYGVRIVCALCGERRQVWDSGKINIFNEKKQIWEDKQ